MSECFAVIAGGGTAGHVYPGLAAANSLVSSGHQRNSILYVGSGRGIEKDIIPPEGFELVTLSGEGVPRRHPFLALKAVFQLLRGIVQAFQLLKDREPKVVLALGGFACFPCAVAAALLRIPVVVHEQNAVAGLANKIVSRWARHSAISYKGTPLRNAIHTGNPVRQAILDAKRVEPAVVREKLKIPTDNILVVVTGGSLGAYRINMAIKDAVSFLEGTSGVTIYHVIGRRDWKEMSAFEGSLNKSVDYHPIEYEYDMPSVLRAADLVISRAGGSITAEISALGLPSILIPLPNAPGDHQTANAKSMVSSGSARLIADADCNGENLAALIKEVIKNPEELGKMRQEAERNAHTNAAELLIEVLEDAAE